MSQQIRVRRCSLSDEAFVYATWLRQLWYSDDTETTLDKDVFMHVHHNLISKVLRDDPVLVACLEDDPDTILGYAAFKNDPFIYVKKAWRSAGVQELLLKAMEDYES